MKTLGSIRKADKLGRIVVPVGIRKELHWDEETPLEISSDGKSVFVRKYEIGCIFYGSEDDLCIFEKKPVCRNCISRLQA